MSAYMHGNLAVKPKKTVETRQRVIIRKKTMPVQEKLLYLFTIVVCVVVAGTIIWRYAQIYDLNLKMERLSGEIETLKLENKKLSIKVEELRDPGRIRDMATQFGYVSPENDMEIQLDSSQSGGQNESAVALSE